MLAAMGGHSDLVLALVKHGARLDVVEKREGCTVLHFAARYGHYDCCSFLLHAHASDQQDRLVALLGQAHTALAGPGTGDSAAPASVSDHSSAGATGPAGTSGGPAGAGAPQPLQQTDSQHASMSTSLIHMCSKGGASALHYAADAGHAAIVRLLLEHGADVAAGVRPAGRFAWMASHQGATALHLAAGELLRFCCLNRAVASHALPVA